MKAAQAPTRPTQRYESLTSFYAADPRRLCSREHDVGLCWRADAEGPLHRAAWVDDTGELYIVRLGPPEQGGGQVELLALIRDRARLEALLEGWHERCGLAGSLGWLRARLSRLNSVRVGANEAPRIGVPRSPAGQPQAALADAVS